MLVMAAGLSGGGGVRRHAAAVAMAAAAVGTAALATALRWRGMSACRRVVAIAVCVEGGGEGIEVGYGGHRSRLRGGRRAAASRDGGDGAKM